jgi:quercetin dioxygenase-like cupin family protein
MFDEPESVVTTYREHVRFQSEGFVAVPVAATPRLRVLVVSLLPDQFLPVHSPAVDLVAVVLEGEGLCAAGASDAQIGPGSVVVVPAGRQRGFRARTPMVLAVVVSPPPTGQDHAEVVRKLREGRWR